MGGTGGTGGTGVTGLRGARGARRLRGLRGYGGHGGHGGYGGYGGRGTRGYGGYGVTGVTGGTGARSRGRGVTAGHRVTGARGAAQTSRVTASHPEAGARVSHFTGLWGWQDFTFQARSLPRTPTEASCSSCLCTPGHTCNCMCSWLTKHSARD